MPRLVLALSVVAVLAAKGCPTGLGCTDEFVPGIVVTIVDSVTGEPRAAEAAGTAREASYVDSLSPRGFEGQPSVMVSRAAAGERPGTYTVTIAAAGYQTWQRSGVRVTEGDCHVHTANLLARLQPAP